VIVMIVVSALLLLANALFVAAEFAVVAAPKTAVEHRANEGDPLAKRLLVILTSPVEQDRYIATAQLGITLASLGLGMYGEHTLAQWFEVRLEGIGTSAFVASHMVASVLSISILTYFHIFIGEMIPKAIALSEPERTARAVYGSMRVILMVLYPFVYVLNAVGNRALALFGVHRKDNAHEQLYTPAELQIIVEESQRGGALRADAGKILRELFEFGDRTAAEVMVPRVRIAGIPVGASPEDLRRIVLKNRRTRYAVYDGDLDHIVGMLHVKDLLRRLIGNEHITAVDVRRIPVVPDTAALDDVLATMQKAHAHMAVVIDEHGGTAGLVGLEDLFEEVVGEIDEGVPEAPPLVRTDDGSVLAAGTVRVDELGHCFDLDLEHDDVDSVSGLVLARLGRPPVVGDVVEYDRLRLEVTATSGRGVKQVRAQLRGSYQFSTECRV
jgi:CBS domain containing-hemolysin-like protein